MSGLSASVTIGCETSPTAHPTLSEEGDIASWQRRRFIQQLEAICDNQARCIAQLQETLRDLKKIIQEFQRTAGDEQKTDQRQIAEDGPEDRAEAPPETADDGARKWRVEKQKTEERQIAEGPAIAPQRNDDGALPSGAEMRNIIAQHRIDEYERYKRVRTWMLNHNWNFGMNIPLPYDQGGPPAHCAVAGMERKKDEPIVKTTPAAEDAPLQSWIRRHAPVHALFHGTWHPGTIGEIDGIMVEVLWEEERSRSIVFAIDLRRRDRAFCCCSTAFCICGASIAA
jgi:Sec-independent protein translocase protein TatA